MKRFGDALDHVQAVAADAVRKIPSNETETLIRELLTRRSVLVFGRGRSGLAGEAFVIRLHHLGLNAFLVGEAVTPPVGQGDLVVCISGSGETFSVVVTAKVARGLGARVVAVTAAPGSSLAKEADQVIVIPAGRTQAELAPLGTGFELACHLYFDALVAELMARRGQDEDELRARHATLE